MEIRIAVASSDETWIDLHFGRAHQFLIYAWDGVEFTLGETRTLRPGCSGNGHDAARLHQAAETVADCRAVIAVRIGPAAVEILEALGVRPLSSSNTVEEALWEVADASWFKGLHKRSATSSPIPLSSRAH